MARINSWSGNDTSELSLLDDNFKNIYEFCKNHNKTFIFGNGKIGVALANYLDNAEIHYEGFVTSFTIDTVKAVQEKSDVGIILGVGDEYYPEVLPVLRNYFIEDSILILPQEFKFLIQFQSPQNADKLFHINIFTTTKCNLGCKSCSTFSPVLTPDFYDIKQYICDMRVFQKMGFHINVIKFTGGEPFLHKDLFTMFETARELFSDVPIECYTNGSLLSSLTDDKFTLMKELLITPVITEYPPLLDSVKSFYAIADKIDISYKVIFAQHQKYFSKRPLDFKKSTPKYMYAACPRFKFNSIFIYKSKIYRCVYSMLANDFNRAFNKNLILNDGDWLDLYSISKDDVYRFLYTRKPFCSYCKPITELIPWGFSERKIEEWM